MYRVFQPVAELQRQGAPVGAVEWGWHLDDRMDQLFLRFDAIVLARLRWDAPYREFGRKWVHALHRAGLLVWYEVDDDLFSPWIIQQHVKGGILPQETPAVKEAHRLSRIDALTLCDGVTVTSQRLATVIRQYTDAPVEVVPNALDWRWFKQVVKEAGPRTIPPLTVGWAGGARPGDDLAPMAWAWGQLAQTHPEVTFVVQGHQPRAVYEQVPPDRIRSIEWLPLEQYPVGLREVDVACCPLADVPFNRAKSPIKAWEAAAAGAAVVASPTIYGQSLKDGEDGYLAATGAEWLAALTRLVDDAVERRRVGDNLRRRVAGELSLEQNAWRWPAAWARLAERAIRWPRGAV
jgi:glycosyltransferase involved in cell wall biosynthesis